LKSESETQCFSDYGLLPSILKDVAELGYQQPTPIQAQCIPPVLEGKDVIGLAQTGTGKTAAFGLPIIQRTAGKVEMGALILAPTRELAQQIAGSLRQLGKSTGVRVAVVVGGIPIKEDYKALQAWPNVLVATPGRLIDHIHSRTIVLSDIQIFTVDEADRMYDMGFIPQINSIMEVLPKKRQTLMFTATMPPEVEKLVRKNMQSPVRIQVGLTAPPARAEQKLYHVQEPDKMPLLLDLLQRSEGRVLVFARTKRKVERLARTVSARRHNVARLHGDREQSQRDAAMAGFRNGQYRILIATDIAARGIDVADIEHVINYDFPGSAEDYIHRIGRTARVAAKGLATSFVTSTDRACLNDLERLISTKLPLIQIGSGSPERAAQAPLSVSGGSRRRSRGGRSRRGGGRARSQQPVAQAS
jgi:ATP-dependent RNA helicase RhlE